MKKLIISAFTALILISVLAVPAVAQDEESLTASVTVTGIINLTITDPLPVGINFGSVSANSDNVSELAQNGTGAVTLTVESDTNVDCDIEIMGSGDFDDGAGHTFSLSNATWSVTDDVADSTPMSATYATIGTSTAYTEEIVDVWHWLSVPSDQYAATYSTTFYYRAIEQ
jgi:hypothetical protein